MRVYHMQGRSTVGLEPDKGVVMMRSCELVAYARAGESAPKPDSVDDALSRLHTSKKDDEGQTSSPYSQIYQFSYSSFSALALILSFT